MDGIHLHPISINYPSPQSHRLVRIQLRWCKRQVGDWRPKMITPLDDFSEKTTMLILHNTYNTYINLYIYIYTMYMCVLYIYTERERERKILNNLNIHVYVYIYKEIQHNGIYFTNKQICSFPQKCWGRFRIWNHMLKTTSFVGSFPSYLRPTEGPENDVSSNKRIKW